MGSEQEGEKNNVEDLALNFNTALKLEPSGTIGPPPPAPQFSFSDFSLIAEWDSQVESGKESHFILQFSHPAINTLQQPTDLLEKVDISLISDKLPPKVLTEMHNKPGPVFLVKFWADLNFPNNGLTNPAFFMTTRFQSTYKLKIEAKTQICTFGRPIWEKLETGWDIILVGEDPINRTCFYESYRTPLCPYVVNFIEKLRADCPDIDVMNGVLENFSSIQVITNKDTEDTLLTMVYVFEVCSPEQSATTGAMFKAYQLSSGLGAEYVP